MGTTSESLDEAAHRRLGVDLFNRTWTLMEQEQRTPEEDDEMLHCAHASAYHWLHAPHTAANRARSQWQCSRAHVLAGQPEGALHHAKRCLEIVQEHPEEMAEFDLPGAYEALARAHALAGHADESQRFLELGRSAAAKIADADDRGIIEADLATVPV